MAVIKIESSTIQDLKQLMEEQQIKTNNLRVYASAG